MGITKIDYGDTNWNAMTGCADPVSAGCVYCWASRRALDMSRQGIKAYAGENPFAPRFHADRLNHPKESPRHWRKPRRILVCFMGDLWSATENPEEGREWRRQIFEVVREVQQHTYIFLTKRVDRMVDEFEEQWPGWTGFRETYAHCHFGVTVEKQQYTPRLDRLLEMPARIRWVSAEPLLEPLDLSPWLGREKINWVAAAPESGPGARLSRREWFVSLRTQAHEPRIPFYFKHRGGMLNGEKCTYLPEDFFGPPDDWRTTGSLSLFQELA